MPTEAQQLSPTAATQPLGTQQTLTILAYDQASDVLRVDWAGSVEDWSGCRSGRMPVAAQAACR